MPIPTFAHHIYKIEPMLLTEDRLNNKDDNSVKQILSLSIEYTFSKIAEQYCNTKDISAADFNKQSDYTFLKLILYPYFIVTSNGHSKSLFSLFGNFLALSIGPVSIPTVFALRDDAKNFLFFNLTKGNTEKLELKPEHITKNWNEIKEEILNTKVSVEGDNKSFRDFDVESDKGDTRPLFKAIDSGFKTLLEGSIDRRFFNYNLDTLKFHAQFYNSYTSKVEGMQEITINDIQGDKNNSKAFFSKEFDNI